MLAEKPILGELLSEVERELGPAIPQATEQHDFEFEFLGLIALADPVRPTVPAAIQECQAAGIRVIMITGDYPGTAMSIARQIGLESADVAITGPEVAAMDDQTLRYRVTAGKRLRARGP